MHKLSVLVAGLGLAALAVTALAESRSVELKAGNRRSLALTVYGDFAVVRDVRTASLPKGEVDLKFLDIPRTIVPSSIQVGSPGRKFDPESQVYGYDLQDRQSLLTRYIGHDVTYRRLIRHNGSDEPADRTGKLLSVNPEVVRFNDGIEISPTGVLSLAPLPGLRNSPTLTVRADVGVGGAQVIETTYLTDGIFWSADYRLDLNKAETGGELSVWAEIRNTSGLDFDRAQVRLVSGDVNRVPARLAPMAADSGLRMEARIASPRSFSDYYIYPVAGSFDVAADRVLRIKLISAPSIAVHKSYQLMTRLPQQTMQQPLKDRPEVRYEFQNDRKTGMGAALPPGTVRIFRRDGESSTLLGEDSVQRISRGDEVSVTAGKSSDIDVTHIQTRYRRSAAETDFGYKVEVHNHRSHKVELTLDEKFYGDWQVTSQSTRGKRVDSVTQRYVLSLAAGEKKSFDFEVRYNTQRQVLH